MGESPTPNAPPLPAALGEVIGAYRLTEVLGHGGMGCVYRGEHLRLGRSAAVKVMHAWVAEDARYTSRLQLEATLVNALRHPNIVDVLDFVQSEGPVRVACVMELLEGPTLAELLTTRRLRPDQALHAAHQLAEALAAVHAQGVVHRDVTPGNVLVVAPLDGDFRVSPCVKLLDFGVAKHLGADDSATLTRAGAVVGTPYYLSPEQARGEASSDPRVDLWAAGVVLYETLTGELPFRAHNFAALLATILRGHPLPPTRLRPEIGRDLERVVLRALAERAEDRWDSAAALRTALLEAAAALPAPAE